MQISGFLCSFLWQGMPNFIAGCPFSHQPSPLPVLGTETRSSFDARLKHRRNHRFTIRKENTNFCCSGYDWWKSFATSRPYSWSCWVPLSKQVSGRTLLERYHSNLGHYEVRSQFFPAPHFTPSFTSGTILLLAKQTEGKGMSMLSTFNPGDIGRALPTVPPHR